MGTSDIAATESLVLTEGMRARQRLVDAVPLAESRVTLAGVSTAVLEGGEGPPVVLLHGQGESWAVWLHTIRDLVGTHRVIVPDLPGHGESRVDEGRLDEDHVVRWLDALIDATCSEPPVVVGHLLGGGIAARHAASHGDRVAHLVLVDTLGLVRFRPAISFALPMIQFLVHPTVASRDRLFDRCFVDRERTAAGFGDRWDDLADYALDRAQDPSVGAALRRLMPRVGVPAIGSERLARITTPTTLVHGREDLQVRLDVAERASRDFGWPLHVIDGAADDPAVEQPDAFVAALQTALAVTP